MHRTCSTGTKYLETPPATAGRRLTIDLYLFLIQMHLRKRSRIAAVENDTLSILITYLIHLMSKQDVEQEGDRKHVPSCDHLCSFRLLVDRLRGWGHRHHLTLLFPEGT